LTLVTFAAPPTPPYADALAAAGDAGLLVASKQYMIIALPLAWLLTRPEQRLRDWLRLVIIATLVAAIVTLPWVVWKPTGFWRSVIALQLHERFRLDSLSLLT